MTDKLAVTVLGNRKAGKSYTWRTLFDPNGNPPKQRRTRSELRWLEVLPGQYVLVFLIYGSPEERWLPVGRIIGRQSPRIVLCSMQYTPRVRETINYFSDHDYSMYTQWLNPGWNDGAAQDDTLLLLPYLLERRAVVSVRDGTNVDAMHRTQELRDFIYGWAVSRDLISRSS